MRHRVRGRELSRDSDHRKALRRNLVQSLFEHGKIRTTPAKAKEVKAFAEKLITLAKTEGEPSKKLFARRQVVRYMQDRRLVDEKQDFITEGSKTVVQKLFNDIAPKFTGRVGGYTRIVRLAEHRIGDGGDVVLLQLTTEDSKPTGQARRSAGLRKKRAERKQRFAAKVLKKPGEAAAPAAA